MHCNAAFFLFLQNNSQISSASFWLVGDFYKKTGCRELYCVPSGAIVGESASDANNSRHEPAFLFLGSVTK